MSLERQREGINRLLQDIYGSTRLLSAILYDAGFSKSEVLELRNERLNDFLTAVVQHWCEWFREILPEPSADVLVRYYSLYGRVVPTLQELGDEFDLSGEQAHQLQQSTVSRLCSQSCKQKLERLVCVAAWGTLSG